MKPPSALSIARLDDVAVIDQRAASQPWNRPGENVEAASSDHTIRKGIRLGLFARLAAILALGSVAAMPQPRHPAPPATPGTTPPPATAASPEVLISVDPRVELVSLIFRLAGNREYCQGRVPSYLEDAEDTFGTFRDHQVVRLATQLRQTRGVSYDACMGLAVHLDFTGVPKLKVPLQPWPESLDRRWTVESADHFVRLAGEFVKETGFRKFFEQHRALYEIAETRMRATLRHAHLAWFEQFFGARPGAAFTVTLGMFNGGSCYGPHFTRPGGQEELFCVLGVWQTDAEGRPEFTDDMLATVVHEFAHSYANPVIDRHKAELRSAGETLFRPLAGRMRSQAYGTPETMLRESLVRACVIRYVRQYKGEAAARETIRREQQRGFLWMSELSDLLANYETHRAEFPTLESFAPRLVAFFVGYAPRFAAEQRKAATGETGAAGGRN